MPVATDCEIAAMSAVYSALKDLDPAEQSRVLSWLQQKLGIGTGASIPVSTLPMASFPQGPGGSLPTAKHFMAGKKPRTDVERVACLADYLTRVKHVTTFNTKEMSALNKEAAQRPFSNAAFAVVNATNAGYLAPAGQGKKQITALGEAVVAALPDYEQVKAAIEEHSVSRRRRPKGKPKSG